MPDENKNENGDLKDELMRAVFMLKSAHMHSEGGPLRGRGNHRRHHDHCEKEFVPNMTEFAFMKHMLARDEQGKNSGRWLAEVRDYLHISKAAVSQMLSSLEKKGLITREPDPENRRTIIVNLTDEGRAAIDAIEHRFDKHIRAVIERVGEDDTREIIRLIYKFVEAMRDVRMNEDAACGAEENE